MDQTCSLAAQMKKESKSNLETSQLKKILFWFFFVKCDHAIRSHLTNSSKWKILCGTFPTDHFILKHFSFDFSIWNSFLISNVASLKKQIKIKMKNYGEKSLWVDHNILVDSKQTFWGFFIFFKFDEKNCFSWNRTRFFFPSRLFLVQPSNQKIHYSISSSLEREEDFYLAELVKVALSLQAKDINKSKKLQPG